MRGLEGQGFTFDVRRKRRELLIRFPHLAGEFILLAIGVTP